MPVCRSPAINVTVSQCPIGASLTKRSPRGFQPLSRSMVVVTAVSSINEVGLIKKALLPNPASARAGHVGALPLFQDGSFAVNDPISRPGVIPGTVGLG
jgi:hypothetical protein